MPEIEWQPLPPLCPGLAVWTDVGDIMLLVFTQDDVPTWEVRHKTRNLDGSAEDLIACGAADTFQAAKAAALFEQRTRRRDRSYGLDLLKGAHLICDRVME
jgi:hypothetical protein